MQTDFKIRQGIYLIKDELTLDLHNDFDFEGLEYSVADRRVSLKWKCSTRENVKSNIPLSIRLDFFEVSEFRFYPRNFETPFTEDNCLNSFGYWTDEEWCDGVFLSENGEVIDSQYLTAFEFMSGAIVVFRAARAIALI